MNDIFPRRFPWLPAMAILAFSGALFLCNGLVWTPMQRYYLGTYLKCGLLGTDPASRAEVHWLYKTAPHGKQELALDADVVPASSGGDRRIPMHAPSTAPGGTPCFPRRSQCRLPRLSAAMTGCERPIEKAFAWRFRNLNGTRRRASAMCMPRRRPEDSSPPASSTIPRGPSMAMLRRSFIPMP